MHTKNTKLFNDISDFPLLYVDYHGNKSYSLTQDLIVKKAKTLIGCPYLWGSNGPTSFDSAGFVQFVYKDTLHKSIPRTTFEQLQCGEKILSITDLLPGDLVFLSQGAHVGIYIGNNQIIHAPFSGQRVKISYISNFYTGRRYL